jgi:hypothetical protein
VLAFALWEVVNCTRKGGNMTLFKVISSVCLGFIAAHLLTSAVLNAFAAIAYVTSDMPFMWSPVIYLTLIATFITAFLVMD